MKERLLHRLSRWFRDFRDRHDLRHTINQLRRSRANWEDTAAQYARDMEYYRGLVVRCGELFGEEARRQDDGGIVDHVLCAKVPDLVEQLVNRAAGQEAALRQLETVDGKDARAWRLQAEGWEGTAAAWEQSSKAWKERVEVLLPAVQAANDVILFFRQSVAGIENGRFSVVDGKLYVEQPPGEEKPIVFASFHSEAEEELKERFGRLDQLICAALEAATPKLEVEQSFESENSTGQL